MDGGQRTGPLTSSAKLDEMGDMIMKSMKKALGSLGYEIRRVQPKAAIGASPAPIKQAPAGVSPIWPLPRAANGPSDQEVRDGFARHDLWHYAYEFEGGLSFSVHHNNATPLADARERPLQRFGHFMPYLLQAEGGSLKGKRVLDIACNSGFWSIQCALLGAEVVGFDARPELIEQANLIKSIVGIGNVQFRMLDFWEMSPQSLQGTFDVVLNLGILYHLSNPLEALRLTQAMARKHILLDTGVYRCDEPVIKLNWEEPLDIRAAAKAGIVAYPSRSGIDLMLRHLGAAEWFEIPVGSTDVPQDYLDGWRASWLIKV